MGTFVSAGGTWDTSGAAVISSRVPTGWICFEEAHCSPHAVGVEVGVQTDVADGVEVAVSGTIVGISGVAVAVCVAWRVGVEVSTDDFSTAPAGGQPSKPHRVGVALPAIVAVG